MAYQSESARFLFQALFEPALQAYEKKAGVSLAQHPLVIKLQSYDTVEAITGLFQDQAQAFGHFEGSDKIMRRSIEMTVSILSEISSTASLADVFGLVRQKALLGCLISLTFIYRHSHLQRRYRLVSPFFFAYVLFSSSYVDGPGAIRVI